MDIVERVGEQLNRAAHRRRRRIRHRRLGAGVLLAAFAVATPTIAQVAPWSPLLGDDRRGTPTRSTSSAPVEQVRGLGVLRRAQRPSDRGPTAEQALKLMDPSTSGVRTDTVRVMAAPAATAVLVSVERFDLGLERMLADDAPRWAREQLQPKRDGLCLFVADPHGDGGATTCSTWPQVRDGRLPSRIASVYYGLVPDGVSRVRTQTEHGWLDATVDENVFAVRDTDGSDRGGHAARRAQWLDPTGTVIRTIEPPAHPAP